MGKRSSLKSKTSMISMNKISSSRPSGMNDPSELSKTNIESSGVGLGLNISNIKIKDPTELINDSRSKGGEENYDKLLEDFDMQVENIINMMDTEKTAVLNSIQHLYFIDEQRTSKDINNMPWSTFLKQNAPPSTTAIRESLAELLNTIEYTKSTTPAKKQNRKKRALLSEMEAPTTLRKSARNMSTMKCQGADVPVPEKLSSNYETPLLGTTKSKRGRKKKVECTPLGQGLPSHVLVTPKFDTRKPLPLSTVRKAKLGEIAVSLKGSPVQISAKSIDLEGLSSKDLDEQTRGELQELHEKVAKLLSI